MKRLRRIAVLFAAVLTVCCLSSCNGSPAADETASGGTAAGMSSVSASEAPTGLQTTEAAAKSEKTTKPGKETTRSEQDDTKQFVYGVWNDGGHLEYTFETDGTGTRADISAGTNDTFRFEVNEKKGTVTFYTGENTKKRKADYTRTDETHLTLTFSKNEIVKLTFGALIRKDDLPFRMGTWKSTNDVLYIFRPDGSGRLADAANSSESTPFRYEVDPANTLLIMHIGSSDELDAAVYTLSEDGKHMMIAYEYDYAELTWQSNATE